ncbi:MAG: hypothetical protein KDD02_16315 [Phaeodactylibacter sp.]|nr:hypothetical protein [Phaeodactylibacter sp.]MCB9300867.1 hypothetical protein [Lewinellaceae bacterium]
MLKHILLIFNAFWVLSFTSGWSLPLQAQSDKWEEFKSYEGRFRVLAPGPLQHRVDSVETSIGTLAYHTYFYQPPKEEESKADNLLYMLSYCDYPENTVHSDSAALLEEFFDATIEQAVKSVKGELAYSSVQDYFGYPGRIWRIDYLNEKAVVKTRAVVVGSRYYSLQTAMVRERNLNPSANRFLDSLRLLE